MSTNAQARRWMAALGSGLVVATVLLPATSAQAATNLWNGSSDSLWSNGANWSGGAVAPGDDLIFPSSRIRSTAVNDTPSGAGYAFMSVNSAGYDLSGNPMELASGISAPYTSGRSTSSIPTTFTGGAGLITVATGGTFAQSGAIAGNQGVTVAGGGTVELAGANSYTGATRINSGVLQADGTIPTPVVLAGGTLSGSGTLNGAGITSTSASTIDPGTVGASGILRYASSTGLSLPFDSTLHVDLNGPTLGTGYDQVRLTSGSALFNPNGANLDIALGYLPAINTSFQIVSQSFSSPITGRFNGISQFGSATSGPVTFSVGYFNSGIILTVVAVNVSTSTWDGGGTTNNWSDAANWVGDTVPARFANLVFPAGAARLSTVNDLAAGFDVTSITIAASGYELAGASGIDLGGAVSATYAAGSSTISLPITLTATRTFSVATGATLLIDGPVSGAGLGITKTSAGTLRVGSSAVPTYTGVTTVTAGVLAVDGSIASSASVSVATGSTVTGSGTVPAVAVASGGQLAPIQLSTGDLSLAAGSQFTTALNGTAVGTGYSQAAATGTVDITGSTLSTSVGFTPALGTSFTIVSNDGSDAVTGTFSGLAEGARFTSGTTVLQISYVGGDGNDIVLTAEQYPPAAVDDAYSATEDTPLVVAAPGVLANDTDAEADALIAVLVAGPANGALTLSADGSFTYTPTTNFAGSDSFTYRAYDGTEFSGTATVTLTIDGVNDAPTAVDDAYGATEDTALVVTTPNVLANDSDAEASPLTAVLVAGPANGTLTLNADGTFTYTPAANYTGSDSFSYRASDGSVLSAAATVSLTVSGVNDAPIAVTDAYDATEGTPLVVTAPGVLANDSDIDSGALVAVLVSGPANGTLTLNADGSFTYTPTASYVGPDSFSYRASDGLAFSNTVTVAIDVNDVPTGTADSYSTDEDTTLVIAAPGVLANDTDSDSLTAILATGPTHGTLTLNGDGSFTYVPLHDFNGTDAFSYRASDGSAEDVVQVTLTVVAVSDAAALANSGMDVTALLLLAASVLAAGAGILVIRRRRVA